MKDRIDIGIVILHYNNINDTKECIDSIKRNIDTELYRIIIVDNKSPNDSGLLLEKQYRSEDKIVVLLNEKNKGFSAGLNVGINYLHAQYDPTFTILSNNDVKLLDKKLYLHLKSEFDRSGFSVLGPLIVNPDGRCDDNPIFDIKYSKINAEYDLKYWKHRLFFTKLGLERLYLFNRNHNYFVKRHKKKIYQIRKDRNPGIFLQRRENIVVHGCFIVLSKNYFKCFLGLDERTFMYAEEDILFLHIVNKKLLSVYQPNIAIYHKGGSSINTSYKIKKDKKVFLYTNYIKAIKSYLLLLQELES